MDADCSPCQGAVDVFPSVPGHGDSPAEAQEAPPAAARFVLAVDLERVGPEPLVPEHEHAAQEVGRPRRGAPAVLGADHLAYERRPQFVVAVLGRVLVQPVGVHQPRGIVQARVGGGARRSPGGRPTMGTAQGYSRARTAGPSAHTVLEGGGVYRPAGWDATRNRAFGHTPSAVKLAIGMRVASRSRQAT